MQKVIYFIGVCILIFTACVTSPEITPETTNLPTQPATTPTTTLTNLSPTATTDPMISLEAAYLINENFEDNEYFQITSDYIWKIEALDDGNQALCNTINDNWGSIAFGQDDYKDYAIQVDIFFIEAVQNPGFELYIRFEEAGGYRATLYNNQYAAMNWYAPYIDFGGREFTVSPQDKNTYRLEVLGDQFQYFINDEMITTFSDSTGISGKGGVGASPGTRICVDNIKLWLIDQQGPISRETLGITTTSDDPRTKFEGDCSFCFFNGTNTEMPVWIDGWTHHPEDDREILFLDQSYQVAKGEEVLFDNKIIFIRPTDRGDINVYGTLTIRNSLLLWDQTQHQQTRLRVKNGGTLDIANSYAMNMNRYWVNWDYEDGSTIILDHFVGDPWTALSGSVNYTSTNLSTVNLTILNHTENTNIQIENAHHLWFELFPPAGHHDLTLPSLRTWDDWDLSGIWPGTTITATDSYIYERDVSLSNQTHVTVRDVEDGFSLGWALSKVTPGFINCELANLGQPGNNEGIHYDTMIWQSPCNDSSLTLINSRLFRVWPVMWGNVILKVYNSNLVDPRHFGGAGVYEIYDSTIDLIATYQGGKIYIENSKILYDVEVKDYGSVIYYYAEGNKEENSFEIYEIDGGRFYRLDQPGAPWE